jgi:hypothetical protein
MLKSTPMLAAGDLNKLVVLLQVNVHDYGSFGLKEFCKKKEDSIPIGNCTVHLFLKHTVHLFGMEDWSEGKVKESFPWWPFHRKITRKETSTMTSFFFLHVGSRQMKHHCF